jgi:protein SCO1/2
VRPFFAFALAASVLACQAPGPAPDGEEGAEPPPSAAFEPIPDVELVTHDGRPVRFYSDLVRNRVVVVQFFFTDCQGICPVSTGRMLELQERLGARLGREVSFLSVTLDPAHDTPAVLAEHALTIGARPGWTFLTGALADITALRYRLGVYDLDPALDADRNQHAGVLVLGNEPRQRWSMKPATLSARSLLAALERVLGSGT